MVHCPICDNPAAPYLTRKAGYSCGVRFGLAIEASDLPDVTYYECGSCSHLFTPDFDDWDVETFRRHIYNEGYIAHDPGYLGGRPERVAAAISVLPEPPRTVLDYGAGNAILGERLAREGIAVTSFDPVSDPRSRLAGSFDLVLSIEVFEHVPDPHATAADIVGAMRPGGQAIVTTLTRPELEEHDHWWLAPRNGHLHGFSPQSLARCFPGLRSHSPGIHSLGGPPPALLDGIERAVLYLREDEVA